MLSKPISETNSLSTSRSMSNSIQITTESIIYPINPLLSRILLPKLNQSLTEIGVIATLKLENQNDVREEEIEKEGETAIKAYGTSVKEATARVKLLNSRLMRSDNKETSNETKTSNTNADNTSTICIEQYIDKTVEHWSFPNSRN